MFIERIRMYPAELSEHLAYRLSVSTLWKLRKIKHESSDLLLLSLQCLSET